MSSIHTSLCSAVRIDVKAVRFQQFTARTGEPDCMIATQSIEVTLYDGKTFELLIHLEDGCPTLALGEPLVMPPVPVTEGETA
ncbi:hypothetical protein AB4156_27740 [Cupriavidus sp. 2MCAB6]|uniref:hypothetical protein n=1 Tax=Cupriavidus sp. 2MCAB6 TaxID=3232981 RepID=UPI003F90F8EB